MRLPRVRFTVRRLMVAVAVVAMGMVAYRSMQIRLAYCREWSDQYKGFASSLEREAFWDGHAIAKLGAGPVRNWDAVRAKKATAAEHRARAAEFRDAAWRFWRRPPYEPPARVGPPLPLLRCPEDDGPETRRRHRVLQDAAQSRASADPDTGHNVTPEV